MHVMWEHVQSVDMFLDNAAVITYMYVNDDTCDIFECKM